MPGPVTGELRQPSDRPGLWIPAFATAAALATGAALALVGPLAALGPLVLVGGILLVGRPRLVLGLYLGAVVLFEADEKGFLPQREVLYEGAPSLADVLLATVALAVVLSLVRERQSARMPEPFTLPLALLAFAFAGGVAHGYLAGGELQEILTTAKAFLPLVLIPFLVVNLLDTERRLVVACGLALALALVKGVEGLVSWATGAGRPVSDTTLTFYEPAANLLLLVAVLGVLAAFLLHVSLPWWGYVAAPLAAASLVLSFRRNFWIAGIVGVLLVLLVSRLGSGRRTLLPVLALLAVGTILTVVWRGPPDLENPVGERLTSLRPTSVATDPYDRYRLDEQRNVLAEIREQPVLGIGLGVPWQLRHPLPVEFESGRFYTHVVVLWYWLKLGVAGAVGYVWLVLAALAAGLGVFRRAGSGVVRTGGLALFAAFAGMAVAETTGSFTGVSSRYTVVAAAALGWLAAARAHERSGSPT